MTPLLESFDLSFDRISARARDLLAQTSDEILYKRPRELPNTFAYDATSKWLMVGGESVVVWDISNFTLKTTLPSEGADIKGLAAGIRQGTILTGSSDNQVRLWDVEKQVVLQKFFSVDEQPQSQLG